MSLNAEASNRAMECRVPLADLWDSDRDAPISYEAARAMFAQDYGTAWAAYVLGTLVVLMHEKGARFTQGVCVLVHSKVPPTRARAMAAI